MSCVGQNVSRLPLLGNYTISHIDILNTNIHAVPLNLLHLYPDLWSIDIRDNSAGICSSVTHLKNITRGALLLTTDCDDNRVALPSATVGGQSKHLWALLVLILPLVALIVFLVIRRRAKK